MIFSNDEAFALEDEGFQVSNVDPILEDRVFGVGEDCSGLINDANS